MLGGAFLKGVISVVIWPDASLNEAPFQDSEHGLLRKGLGVNGEERRRIRLRIVIVEPNHCSDWAKRVPWDCCNVDAYPGM